MKVSTILNNAAEKYLLRGVNKSGSINYPDCRDANLTRRAFSCEAIIRAEGLWVYDEEWEVTCAKSRGIAFIKSLGVSPKNVNLFNEFPAGVQRQAARYAWLKFAAARAKELNV